MNQKLPCNEELRPLAKKLRKAGNLSEVLLWQQINDGQLFGLDFNRQEIIGNYIVDFYCSKKRVVIEIDGCTHDHKVEEDAEREKFLKGLELKTIHILDIDVKKNLKGVMQFLKNYFLEV